MAIKQVTTFGQLPNVTRTYNKGVDADGKPITATVIDGGSWTRTDLVDVGTGEPIGNSQDGAQRYKEQLAGLLANYRKELEQALPPEGANPKSKSMRIADKQADYVNAIVTGIADGSTEQKLLEQLRTQGLAENTAEGIAKLMQKETLEGILAGISDGTFRDKAGLPQEYCEAITKNIQQQKEKFGIEPSLIARAQEVAVSYESDIASRQATPKVERETAGVGSSPFRS